MEKSVGSVSSFFFSLQLKAGLPLFSLFYRWFLNNGGSVLAAATAVSSFAILNFFRYKLRLGNTARFSTYLPTVLVPATGSFLIHEFVSTQHVKNLAYKS